MIVLVVRGDARLDHRKYKAHFGNKARMLETSEVEQQTGHPIGGVSPFGLSHTLPVFCDVSLKDFPIVLPAGGAHRTRPHGGAGRREVGGYGAAMKQADEAMNVTSICARHPPPRSD